MRIVDLSVPLRNQSMDPNRQEILYMNHVEFARMRTKVWGVPLEPVVGPEGFLASEVVTADTHAGTHIDAPYHYGPTCEGRPARTVDQLPLEWFFGPGVCLDFHRKEPGELITAADVEKELERIGHRLRPHDIVLVRTDTTTRYYDSPGFDQLHPGLSRDAVFYLVDRGVKVIGIDAWGLDVPTRRMVESLRQGDRASFYQAHLAGREREYVQIEKLFNLDRLPPTGFRVACFPIKIERASGAWCRAVAIFE